MQTAHKFRKEDGAIILTDESGHETSIPFKLFAQMAYESGFKINSVTDQAFDAMAKARSGEEAVNEPSGTGFKDKVNSIIQEMYDHARGQAERGVSNDKKAWMEKRVSHLDASAAMLLAIGRSGACTNRCPNEILMDALVEDAVHDMLYWNRLDDERFSWEEMQHYLSHPSSAKRGILNRVEWALNGCGLLE